MPRGRVCRARRKAGPPTGAARSAVYTYDELNRMVSSNIAKEVTNYTYDNDLPHIKWRDRSNGKVNGESGHIFFGKG